MTEVTSDKKRPPFRLLITGSRDWDDPEEIWHRLNIIHKKLSRRPAVLLSGACPTGADRIAESHWLSLGSPWANDHSAGKRTVERYPANWDFYGKSAGFKRNAQMIAAHPVLCLAFIRHSSKGATHTANLAQAAGIKSFIFRQ